MTQKDYELAAKITQRRGYNTKEWISVLDAFLALFREDGNTRFDSDRFRAACIPGANVKARGNKAT